MNKKLKAEMKSLLKQANRDDSIVLCENGKETENDYPVWMAYERTPDTKSPSDWINGIVFFYELQKKTSELALKIKVDGGKISFP